MRRADIVAEARTWVGTPWKHQASQKGRGADCIGFVSGVVCALRGPLAGLEDYRGYGRRPDSMAVLVGLRRLLRRVPEGRPGDVILVRIDHRPQHIAILTGDQMIIHADQGARGVVEHRIPPGWKPIRYYAFPGAV